MKPVTTWKELKDALAFKMPVRRKYNENGNPHYVFRGEKERKRWDNDGKPLTHSWLKTTLERTAKEGYGVIEYMKRCHTARAYIVNLFSDSLPDFNEKAVGHPFYWDGKAGIYRIRNTEFMAYLRQHEFPSPLLDWSESPYVATYFALNRGDDLNDINARIYFYQWENDDKMGIFTIGPFIRVHNRRHAIQQCLYTYCRGSVGKGTVFTSHSEKNIDYIAINFNEDERLKALAELQAMNITQYSLFGTLDALVETAWRKVAGD
jgi:hypothetical protein